MAAGQTAIQRKEAQGLFEWHVHELLTGESDQGCDGLDGRWLHRERWHTAKSGE